MSSFERRDPVIVAEPSDEALLAQRIAGFIETWDAFRAARPDLDMPAYDVETLEFDPAIIALQAAAYGDLHFHGVLNDVGRATLLVAFATGADLDLHGLATRTPGFPDGVARWPGELDPAYAARTIEARAGSSAAGPDEWWLSHIRAADAGALGATLTYQGLGRLTIAVAVAEDADPDAVLTAVRERLGSGWVRPQGITVTVVAA